MDKKIVIEKLKNYYLTIYNKPFPNLEKSVREALSAEREHERIEMMRRDFGLDVAGKKTLEVGSGLGLFNIVCQQRGGECYGIEPDETKLDISLELLDEAKVERNIARSVGENLPFAEATFDLVVSFQVLEHTRIPERVLQEALRVLKPGGHLYFVVPNYNSFWEGHYGLIWLPQFPKVFAKIYAKLAGKDPDFLDELQYITPSLIRKALRYEKVEILDFGIETWERRLESASFSTWGSTGTMQAVTQVLHKLRIVPIVKYLGRTFSLYYPIILVARKV